MQKNVYNIFINVIENLKTNKNTKSIILVGSSKDKKMEIGCKINDIDLFIIVENQEKDQVREIKLINNIEFDMNYISIQGSQNFIDTKTYFFLNIKDGKLIYDVDSIGENIIKLCHEKYEEGPDKLSIEKKKFEINQLISDISRLSEKVNYEDFEYDFLINMYLSQVIKLYYIVNDKWLPKDKKLLKHLKKDEANMYDLVCSVKDEHKYEKLMEVVNYCFKDLE